VSSSSSCLLDHQNIKKRRRDRTRLRSLSVANVRTSARTMPLHHSFQKRRLYRMHGACYWSQQVGHHLSLQETKPKSPAARVCLCLVWCIRRIVHAVLVICCGQGAYSICGRSTSCVSRSSRVNELNIKNKDCSESCLSNHFFVWLSLKPLYSLTRELKSFLGRLDC